MPPSRPLGVVPNLAGFSEIRRVRRSPSPGLGRVDDSWRLTNMSRERLRSAEARPFAHLPPCILRYLHNAIITGRGRCARSARVISGVACDRHCRRAAAGLDASELCADMAEGCEQHALVHFCPFVSDERAALRSATCRALRALFPSIVAGIAPLREDSACSRS